ncbi:MAG TPA: hypothetical protein VI454_16855 [Verrucomicrobiae bacterium]|jgi:hypothetical protein
MRKALLIALAAIMWLAAGFAQRALNADRAALGLTRMTPLENAPPLLTFTTVALGGFRGLVANFLWVRAGAMQEQGRYFEVVQLADWITKLQPHAAMVWRYQAWNMAFNISVKFRDPADRWRWVSRGIELLRDEGLRYNPNELQLYQELGLLFQIKLGYYLDDAHVYYKDQWAKELMKVIGVEKVDYVSLINPQTDDQRRRAAVLREKFKLDPARMREIDQRFGPLEWRLPEAHAIYWAALGLERCGREGVLPLRRIIWQSMQTAFLRGRMIPNLALRRFETAPNLAILAKANSAYEEMMAANPEEKAAIMPGHRNFLREAVVLLYVHNRIVEADFWLRKLRATYPDALPANQSLDEFALAKFSEQLQGASLDRVRANIEGVLNNAYWNLALGETDQAAGLERLAAQMWRRHQTKFADQQERMSLPPLKDLREQVLARLLDAQSPLPPQMQAQLRTALTQPAATNASPPAQQR